MPALLLGVVILGFFAFSRLGKGTTMDRLFDLEDIEPENQGGNFKKDYDLIFFHVAEIYKVPFALMKAHAIQESSLNPRAYANENPSGRQDRIGWASRGFMQVLWWPGSNRFAKYGFPDAVLKNGDALYDVETNLKIGAAIIKDNLIACDGNLRDAINMYNTGVKESKRVAPHNYVDRVMKNYNIILGKEGLS